MPIQITDLTKLANGAQFFTADLHVHSYGGSHDVKDATMTVEAIVDTAVTHSISILALTDHNSSKNTARSIEYARTKYREKLLVLAGVEVTTEPHRDLRRLVVVS
jgi:predicted metal-dependent phosphoesterase TrpH